MTDETADAAPEPAAQAAIFDLIDKFAGGIHESEIGTLAQLAVIRTEAQSLLDTVSEQHRASIQKDAEFLLVVRQWEDLQTQFDLLDKEADGYAKNMHEAHQVNAILWERLLALDPKTAYAEFNAIDEPTRDLVQRVLLRSLPQKGGTPPSTVVRPMKSVRIGSTEVKAQLSELES